MRRKHWIIAALAAGCVAAYTPALAQSAPGDEPAAEAAAARPDPSVALIAADLDTLIEEARQGGPEGRFSIAWAAISYFDAFDRGALEDARAALERLPGGVGGAGGDMFEPFLLAAEGQGDRAVARFAQGAGGLPDPYPLFAKALVLEGLGRLEEAADVYAALLAVTDVRPGPEGEAQTEEDFMRAVNATRTSQMLYRAALTNHRLGRSEEASRLYELVAAFSSQSPDLIENRARLADGRPPHEAPLDPERALGRWLLVLSDFLQITEGLMAIVQADGPLEGLASPAGTMLLQFGVRLDPHAEDWTISAASQLIDARGYVGAARLLDRVPGDSLWAADAQLQRAALALKNGDEDEVEAAAERAIALDDGRWSVLAGAGDYLRMIGRDRAAIAALNRALPLAVTDKDRAGVLASRAYAHFYAGRMNDAARDVNEAVALHPSDGIRYTAVAVLMENEDQWREAVEIARQMFAEQPDSSNRLNSLGYTLIQRPEGLEEGYRLLWRGFSFRETDYAVVDSLGWAYYLYGHFPEARALIERAHQLTGDEPNPEILDHLGDVHWRLGDHDRARATWREAIAARPDVRRRRALEDKIARGLRTPAPRLQELPEVNLPSGPRERGDT
ncbi:MAG: hypothetical protein HXY28_08885 [Hydrogenophilaceae bacterium]|jgi:tetratricopeptide (TPR) repeat protein|nr:hypothetical protein [Hydrogenophilaceae bacterium]